MEMAYIKKLGLLVIVIVLVSGGTVISGSPNPSDEVVTVEDTLVGDRYPGRVRVQDAVKNGSGLPAVPMVEIDTNVYEKRLWLAEKKRVSILGEEGRWAWVIAFDSVVFVEYISSSSFKSAHSHNHGLEFVAPTSFQEIYSGWTIDPPVLFGELMYLPYAISISPASWVLLRTFNSESASISDSVVIHTESESWENVMSPRMAAYGDTLYIQYRYRLDDDTYYLMKKSLDSGATWSASGAWLGPEVGSQHSLFIFDSAMCKVHTVNGPNEVFFSKSFDRGESWQATEQLSLSIPASQRPASSSDGISSIHAVWYDFEALPPEATGGWVYYRRSLDAGESWEDIRCLSTEASSEAVEIWADTDYVYACWSDARYGSPNLALYFRYSHDGGSSWSPEIQIVDETDPAWDPDVYAQGDFVYIVWHEQHPPDWVWEIQYMLGVWYLPGDVDLSEAIDIADLVYVVDWMFTGGPAPIAHDAAQMDGLGEVDISDLVYIVDYMFNDGPPPVGGEGL